MVKTVQELQVYQRGYEWSLRVHRLSVGFPKLEQFGGVADQIRRASKSIPALLTEGFARQRGSRSEFRRYVMMAVGSSDEMQLWLRYAMDLGYMDASEYEQLREAYVVLSKMLQKLWFELSSDRESDT
jgi:four helix bundle protein